MDDVSYRVSLDCKPTCPACHAAFKKAFGALKGLFLHLRDIHIRNEFAKTKKQERVNSAFAGRTGPGHKQRELAGLPHLHTLLHQAARRNRRRDTGRGSRHHDIGP